MNKKKRLIILAVILGIFLAGIAVGTIVINKMSLGITQGICLISENGTRLLISENSPISLRSISESKDCLEGLESGDELLVFHSGIAESYPAQTGVYYVIKLGEGKENEISQSVIDSLTELGWIKSNEDNLPDTETEDDENELLCDFSYDYISTNLPSPSVTSKPAITVINSFGELDLYRIDNYDTYGLTNEFISKTAKYDEEFFDTSSLIVILIEEGSTGILHSVSKVTTDGIGTVSVHLERDVPEAGDCAMAYHHIVVALSKAQLGEKNIQLYADGKNMLVKQQLINAAKGFANITLTLPNGWDYDINMGAENTSGFGINIYHRSSPSDTISIEYTDAFGVCGTDLTTETIVLGEYTASKGIYGGNPTWDYIVFKNTPGYYVIYNNTDPLWWNTYSGQAIEIFNSFILADGIITEEEAVKIAEEHSDGTRINEQPTFDSMTGEWTLRFEKSETVEIVKISAEGKIL